MDGAPSALKRQARKALNPDPETRSIYGAKRTVNEQGNARIIVAY